MSSIHIRYDSLSINDLQIFSIDLWQPIAQPAARSGIFRWVPAQCPSCIAAPAGQFVEGSNHWMFGPVKKTKWGCYPENFTN